MKIPECRAIFFFLPPAAVAAGIQQFLFSAELPTLIGTTHISQNVGQKKTLRTFALC